MIEFLISYLLSAMIEFLISYFQILKMDDSGQVSDSLLSMLSDKNFEEVDDAGPDDIDEECDDVFELPEHEFVHGTIMGKTGSKEALLRYK